jgi:hypothetical protein
MAAPGYVGSYRFWLTCLHVHTSPFMAFVVLLNACLQVNRLPLKADCLALYLQARDIWMQVVNQLKGVMPLPWEQEMSSQLQKGLEAFKEPVLQLLHREPAQRASMKRFHAACTHLFSGRTTVEA